MIFHEIYGCYYNAVSKILDLALKEELTEEKVKEIINKYAFSESFLKIIPALKNQEWKLFYEDYKTPIKNSPSIPLTTLQKRWFKSICLDKRIRLFGVDTEMFNDVKPLFTEDDYFVFDKYSDGDDFEDETYIKNFHTILDAMHQKRRLIIEYTSRNGKSHRITCSPINIEYSEKDDKFRLIVARTKINDTINLGRITYCELSDSNIQNPYILKPQKKILSLELIDERKALERAMLHFAHFEKQAEKLSENTYKITIYYEENDETELVIRILSFGPFIKVTEPDSFINLIKERLRMQKSCGL